MVRVLAEPVVWCAATAAGDGVSDSEDDSDGRDVGSSAPGGAGIPSEAPPPREVATRRRAERAHMVLPARAAGRFRADGWYVRPSLLWNRCFVRR